MEELKKEELEAEEVTEAAKESAQEEGKQPEVPVKSYMLRTLGGIYLVWTGYRLCKNVLEGAEGASWGFMIPGILFLAVGGALVYVGFRGVMRDDKAKKAREAAEKAALEAEKKEGAETAETDEKTEAAPKAKMSIADRAKLVKNLEEEE